MKETKVIEIELDKQFRFMYSNFIISSQSKLYLLLAQNSDEIDVLEFDFSIYKYGYPNDEVGHPLMKFGLGFYGFYEVLNSTWTEELRLNNSSHSRHSDSIYSENKHYIAKFKDVTLEVISRGYKQKVLPKSFFKDLIEEEINFLHND